MQVGPVMSTLVNPVERHPALDPAASKPTPTPTPEKAATAPPKAPFDPAPAIRPTIQDTIDVDRTLIALRRL